jgi:hypothetical protein
MTSIIHFIGLVTLMILSAIGAAFLCGELDKYCEEAEEIAAMTIGMKRT